VGDVLETQKTPQILKAVELNLYLGELYTKMLGEITYRQYPELDLTYREFRMCLIELYMLVRNEKEVRDFKIFRKLKQWKGSKYNPNRVVDYANDALNLYAELSSILIRNKIL